MISFVGAHAYLKRTFQNTAQRSPVTLPTYSPGEYSSLYIPPSHLSPRSEATTIALSTFKKVYGEEKRKMYKDPSIYSSVPALNNQNILSHDV